MGDKKKTPPPVKVEEKLGRQLPKPMPNKIASPQEDKGKTKK